MCLWGGMQLQANTAAYKNSHLQLPRGVKLISHMKVHESRVKKGCFLEQKAALRLPHFAFLPYWQRLFIKQFTFKSIFYEFLAPDFCLSGKIHRTNWECVDFVTNNLFQKQFLEITYRHFPFGIETIFLPNVMWLFQNVDHKDMPKLCRGVPPLVWHVFNRLSDKVFFLTLAKVSNGRK